ncbi:MAG TPA: hypothetical protein VIV40_41945 [Kofleriaceae bacterium]
MRTAIVAMVTAIALLTSVVAGPRKVLVLPLDGNAPAAQKSQLNDSIVRMSKDKIEGDVTIGDTTFAETATAVGCDPAAPECAETVRSTLGVDELVYGSAESANGSTTVTVHRMAQGSPPSSQVAVITESDSGDKAEPALAPVFGGAAPEGSGSGSAAVETKRTRRGGNFFDTRERKLGVGLAAGGVIALVIGVSYWSSESDLQDQIDNHPKSSLTEITALKALEDRAGEKAMWGNIMVGVGLALAGAGAYFLYKDHKNRSATITPAPVEAGGGMTLVLGGHW